MYDVMMYLIDVAYSKVIMTQRSSHKQFLIGLNVFKDYSRITG